MSLGLSPLGTAPLGTNEVDEAEPVTDILLQNQLHQIQDGLAAQTAAGLNGVLVT